MRKIRGEQQRRGENGEKHFNLITTPPLLLYRLLNDLAATKHDVEAVANPQRTYGFIAILPVQTSLPSSLTIFLFSFSYYSITLFTILYLSTLVRAKKQELGTWEGEDGWWLQRSCRKRWHTHEKQPPLNIHSQLHAHSLTFRGPGVSFEHLLLWSQDQLS
jgi:hypothetical protein